MAKKLFVLASFVKFMTVILAVFLCAAPARASEKVLVSFNKTLGANPLSTLIADADGNLYGTTATGGKANCGTVFELSPNGDKWTETVLYSFTGCKLNTMVPRGPLVMDKSGNLYGVLQGYYIDGWVFQLTKSGSGTWSESIIHLFTPKEGMPNPELTLDSAGNVFGTTQLDSTGYDGEVFEFMPQPNGTWREVVVYSFPAPDGTGMPTAGVTFDSKGNLYGPLYFGVGGEGTFGAIYELSPQPSGPWTFKLIQNFTVADFGNPYSQVVFDSNGNLYSTGYDGVSFFGEIFVLVPKPNGTWVEETIHRFDSGTDGAYPVGTLVVDASGNLYGTTMLGGNGCNQNYCGLVYKFTRMDNGDWKEEIVHAFQSATDGSEPDAGLFLDGAGNLYGTTSFGGSRYGYGTVYEITP